MSRTEVLDVFQFAACLILALTGPLVVELALLTAASLLPARGSARPGKALRRLTILIPAHNEALLVERCIRSLVPRLRDKVSVLVVAHNCTDDTALRADQAGAEVVRLDDATQNGKACALRFGFAHALHGGAEAVAVVDADSVVCDRFVESMQTALSGDADAVQCAYRVLPAAPDAGPTLTGIAFQGFNLVRPRGRMRLGISAGIFGNGFGLKRETLEAIPYSADSVVEDLEYHIQLVTAGRRVHFLERATVFGEMPQGASSAGTQRTRWEGGRLLMMKSYPLRLLGEIVRGHFRLIEPLLDIFSIPIAMAVLALTLGSLLPVPWLRWYALAGILTIGGHFMVAVKSGATFWQGMGVLARVPKYICWKVLLTPRILMNSRRNASWVRTGRDKSTDFTGSVHPDALE